MGYLDNIRPQVRNKISIVTSSANIIAYIAIGIGLFLIFFEQPLIVLGLDKELGTHGLSVKQEIGISAIVFGLLTLTFEGITRRKLIDDIATNTESLISKFSYYAQ